MSIKRIAEKQNLYWMKKYISLILLMLFNLLYSIIMLCFDVIVNLLLFLYSLLWKFGIFSLYRKRALPPKLLRVPAFVLTRESASYTIHSNITQAFPTQFESKSSLQAPILLEVKCPSLCLYKRNCIVIFSTFGFI